ncbi:ficolin-1-like isoform X2 [Babylonia areolata]|uniref:ficolin-1-like isoform X2 n=1 Tax=Babylonia areolata TaxID=304850 RepID=UPI003FD5AF55
MAPLWALLTVSCSLTIHATFSDYTVMDKFVNKCVRHAAVTDHVLFKNNSTRSVLDCAQQCNRDGACLAFTFARPLCQGYIEVTTSDSQRSTMHGAVTFVRREADTTVRCQSPNGEQVLMVPRHGPLTVVCQDNWMVFLRRHDGSVDFYRDWLAYQDGFGNIMGEFWLGLEALHHITNTASYRLHVDLGDWEGNSREAVYTNFFVGPVTHNYPLYLQFEHGTANDSMSGVAGSPFSTMDRDHDSSGRKNCAEKMHGAWWYQACSQANLCGRYYNSSRAPAKDGVIWKAWRATSYSLKFAQLRIRPEC